MTYAAIQALDAPRFDPRGVNKTNHMRETYSLRSIGYPAK